MMVRKDISGILNINKPAGITSHDVVDQVRKLVGVKKVGHTGTLDPIATGVLLICLGQATRLIEYLMPAEKQYQATILLGQTTNTYDAEGEVVVTHDPSGVTEKAFRQKLVEFVGTIHQIPPPFSAIKKNGVPLYKLARKGKPVTPAPRRVHIAAIDLISFNLPEVVIYVTCSSGTYIRSIAHDLGQVLGVGAHLTKLTRVANGNWHIKDSISLPILEQAVAASTLDKVLHPKEKAVAHLPSLILSPDEEKRVEQGQFIMREFLSQEPVIAAYNSARQLVALLTPRRPGILKPQKVFSST
jgi:tRNA pseudouridine55 synthase